MFPQMTGGGAQFGSETMRNLRGLWRINGPFMEECMFTHDPNHHVQKYHRTMISLKVF